MSKDSSYSTESAGQGSGQIQASGDPGTLRPYQQWLLAVLALLVAGATLTSAITGQPSKSGPFAVAGLVLTALIATIAVIGHVPERIRLAGVDVRLSRPTTQQVVESELDEDSRDLPTSSGISAVVTLTGSDDESQALRSLVSAIEAGDIISAQNGLFQWAKERAKKATLAVAEGNKEDAFDELSGLVKDPYDVLRRQPRGRQFEEQVGELLSSLKYDCSSLQVQPTDHRGGFRWDFLVEVWTGESAKLLAVEARLGHRFLDRLNERLQSDPRVQGLIVVSASFREEDVEVRHQDGKPIVICQAVKGQIREALKKLVNSDAV